MNFDNLIKYHVERLVDTENLTIKLVDLTKEGAAQAMREVALKVVEEILEMQYPIGIKHPTLNVVDVADIESLKSKLTTKE